MDDDQFDHVHARGHEVQNHRNDSDNLVLEMVWLVRVVL
jgi:hypothetical protein